MPSVTVKLIYTPRPEGDAVEVPEIDCRECVVKLHETGNVGFYSSGAYVSLGRTTPAEALALSSALTLVAGCADTRWRGWHWEARDADGNLLAVTPPGQWYAKREDCERAVITLFGDRSEVVMGPGAPVPGGAMVLVLREPTPDPIDGPTIKPELIVRAFRDIAKLHAPVELRGEDRSVCEECGGFYPCPTVALIPETTNIPDVDPEGYKQLEDVLATHEERMKKAFEVALGWLDYEDAAAEMVAEMVAALNYVAPPDAPIDESLRRYVLHTVIERLRDRIDEAKGHHDEDAVLGLNDSEAIAAWNGRIGALEEFHDDILAMMAADEPETLPATPDADPDEYPVGSVEG